LYKIRTHPPFILNFIAEILFYSNTKDYILSVTDSTIVIYTDYVTLRIEYSRVHSLSSKISKFLSKKKARKTNFGLSSI